MLNLCTISLFVIFAHACIILSSQTELHSFGENDDCFEHGIDYIGFDIDDGHYVSTESASDCEVSYQNIADCEFWTWDPDYHTAFGGNGEKEKHE